MTTTCRQKQNKLFFLRRNLFQNSLKMYSFNINDIPGKGRAIVATKLFNAGDVIFEEEPFVSCQFSWNSTYGYAACDHCMRPLETVTENVRRLSSKPNTVVPFLEYDPTKQWLEQFCVCPKCKVRYCSEDCRMEAFTKYHRVACMGTYRTDDSHPINKLNEIWKKMHYPPETGTIMILVRIMAMYQQSADKANFMETLQAFQSLVVNKEQQIYHKMLGENFENQMEQLYTAFCAAFQGEEFGLFTTPEAFKTLLGLVGTNSQGVATSVLAEWVKKVSDINMPEADKTKLDKQIDDIYSKVGDFAGEFLNNEGSGLYLLQSKVNHSCVPNAQSTFPYSNDIVVLKATQTIQPNEEICISYLDECQLERSRHSRQKILKDNYIFICKCPKCELEVNDPDETSEDEYDDEMEMEYDDEMDE